jgi:hypothetical protein
MSTNSMAGVINQNGSTFSGRNEVQGGNIIQAGNISGDFNIN